MLSWLVFAFNVSELRVGLIPFFANLLLFGWSMGIFSTALIMRYGQAAESLAWAVPFMVQPITAVYYPVSVMPGWLQWVALGLPSTHVFEGMRAVMDGARASRGRTSAGPADSICVFLALVGLFYARTLATVREKGLLTKVATN